MFVTPFESILKNINMGNVYDYSVLSLNVTQAMLIYQQAATEMMQKLQKNELMSAVSTRILGIFLSSNSKFWANSQNVNYYYSKLLEGYGRCYFLGNSCNTCAGGIEVKDKRFSAPEWHENPVYHWIKNFYQLHANALLDTVSHYKDLGNTSGAITPKELHILEFCYKQLINAVSPSNFVMTNPEVLKEIYSTRGNCLRQGAENFLSDVRKSPDGHFRMSTVDGQKFAIGVNIVVTPGKVVYQNKLMQLIQYQATTKEVNKTPILITTAWINKYYILDLKSENSFVRWLVEQGHSVFLISWINPDASYADTKFEDYIFDGVIRALEEVRKITKEEQVNCISYCLGGTLTAIAAAYLQTTGKNFIKSLTLLTSFLDFSKCGDVGIFVDDTILQEMDRVMAKQGYFDGHVMFSTFSWLRPNDMVWPYHVNNYLLGKQPAAFDILYWNADSTRMPYAMHSYYLKNMYMNNSLIKKNEIKIKEVPIDLSKVIVPMYYLATKEDHIVPWHSLYSGVKLCGSSSMRFVLTQSGHVAGVVNPPAKNKYGYYVNENLALDADAWLAGAQETKGSWWLDWEKWIEKSGVCGPKIEARTIDANKAIEDAPGSYVKKSYVNF
ncbi:Poly(3-hydroxyalkanoate) polymerase subunit PhaC [Alphaproteobacteria bacterium]